MALFKKKDNYGYGYGYGYGYSGYGYGYGYGGYGYGKGYGYDNGNFQESIKTLRTNIQFSGIDEPIKTICLTSSIPGEGKSTISHFLAIEMAKAGKKTLIVECDMRRPTQGNMFKFRPKKGLTSYLAGDCTLEEAAAPTQTENLYFLDVDARVVNPVELLDSNRFSRAMEEMKEKFDIVIYDTLPISMFIDSAIIAAQVDATVLVIRKGKSDIKNIEKSIEQLQKANANIIGTVFNDADPERGLGKYYYYRSRYKYDYGYGYGYGYGREQKDVKKAEKGAKLKAKNDGKAQDGNAAQDNKA